jgi:hypothetical protein
MATRKRKNRDPEETKEEPTRARTWGVILSADLLKREMDLAQLPVVLRHEIMMYLIPTPLDIHPITRPRLSTFIPEMFHDSGSYCLALRNTRKNIMCILSSGPDLYYTRTKRWKIQIFGSPVYLHSTTWMYLRWNDAPYVGLVSEKALDYRRSGAYNKGIETVSEVDFIDSLLEPFDVDGEMFQIPDPPSKRIIYVLCNMALK